MIMYPCTLGHAESATTLIFLPIVFLTQDHVLYSFSLPKCLHSAGAVQDLVVHLLKMENEFDLFEIVYRISGDDVAGSRSENPVILGPLE